MELENFSFSCVVVGQQYNLKFIEIFGIMADIFLLAIAICVFGLGIFCQLIVAVFKFAFSNKINILNLYRNFLIKMNVL